LHDHPDPNAHLPAADGSDSIALALACRLSAERLVIVKTREIEPGASVASLSTAGILDRDFARLAADAAFPIDIVHSSALAYMRSLLLGMGGVAPV
jgi:5-(aminomethyl)-3-furanmethanol phosphate kinase